MTIVLAILLGFFFGFALDQAEASNPQRIIGMLRLRDLHLMKVILFAIGFSSLLLFILLSLGAIDPGHLSVKPAHYGVILGGSILGIGFAIGGYCPGTCIVASARGRKDALAFLLGGIFGAFAYMIVFGWIQDGSLFEHLAGGAVTVVKTYPEKFASLTGQQHALLVAGPIAIFFMIIALILPSVPGHGS
jgi:hypothetical protein